MISSRSAKDLFNVDAHDKAAAAIDNLGNTEKGKIDVRRTADLSPELRNVKDNLKFVKKLDEEPIAKDIFAKLVFGVKLVDPRPVVFGNNIWNRSIWVTDQLNDLYTSATVDMMQKYLKKKRKVNSNLIWMLILIGGGGFAIIIMLMLMGVFG